MNLFKFIAVIAGVLFLHYLLWSKVYKTKFGHLKGASKVLLFIGCALCEGIITVLLGIYVLNI